MYQSSSRRVWGRSKKVLVTVAAVAALAVGGGAQAAYAAAASDPTTQTTSGTGAVTKPGAGSVPASGEPQSGEQVVLTGIVTTTSAAGGAATTRDCGTKGCVLPGAVPASSGR